jgi:hypothetical protein
MNSGESKQLVAEVVMDLLKCEPALTRLFIMG